MGGMEVVATEKPDLGWNQDVSEVDLFSMRERIFDAVFRYFTPVKT